MLTISKNGIMLFANIVPKAVKKFTFFDIVRGVLVGCWCFGGVLWGYGGDIGAGVWGCNPPHRGRRGQNSKTGGTVAHENFFQKF